MSQETAPSMTREQLEARIRELESQVKAKPAGNAEYELTTFKDGKVSLRLEVPGCKAIFGGRSKYTGLIAEVKSGRLEQWLTQHPELK